MGNRAQGGGEVHESERCDERFPTAQELQCHILRAPLRDSGYCSVPKGTGGSQTEGGGGMLQTE